MILKGRNQKTLLILGAGATRGALSGTFSPRISPPLNADFFEILGKFVQTPEGKRHVKAYNRLTAFLNTEIGRKGIEKPTMEEVFNVLFISKDLTEIFRKGRGRNRTKGFRQEVRDFLSLLVRVFHFVQGQSNHRDGLEHHKRVTESLRPGDVIMTLNYDTLMDNALVEAGWNPQKGYGFSAKVKYEHSKSNTFSTALQNVLLLKPHGSFNWFAKGSFKNLEQMLEKRPVSQVQISDLPRLYESKAKNLVRFFIPPLYTKFFKNKFWSKLWKQTYDAVRSADRFIVVGCSLIATDYHLRAILSKSISDKRGKFKEIIVVDRSPEVQKHLKRFFRGRSETGCKVYPTFSDFVRKLLKA